MNRIAMIAVFAAVAAAPAPHAAGEEAGRRAAFVPRLGDIMTLLQIRHAKLWFAGNSLNWDLAAFELEELKEGLEDVAKHHPKSNDVLLGPAIEAIDRTVIANIGKAVAARDRRQFRVAFDRLTASCNACHQVTKRAFIVIQRPRLVPLSNQTYQPPRQRGPRPKVRR